MNAALIKLLHLSDPSLPVGSYAHSAGLETYVQQGIVRDVASVREFVIEMLSQNLFHTDAALVSLSYDVEENSLQEILTLDNECTAVKIPREIRMASQRLSSRLMKVFKSVESASLQTYAHAVKEGHALGHYCITYGLLASALKIPKQDALTAFYYNAAASMITNSVKLIPLSQQHGQEILLSVHDLIDGLAEKSMQPDRALIGWCCPGFDLRSMQHERLYSRLYMS